MKNKRNGNLKQFRASPTTLRRIEELKSLWGTENNSDIFTRAIAIAHTVQTNPKFRKQFNEVFVMVK